MSPSDLKILVIGENRSHTSIIKLGLIESGYENIEILNNFSGFAKVVELSQPYAIIADFKNPQPRILQAFFALARATECPIAVFVDHSDPVLMQKAIDAGISAYVIDGLKKDRVGPILEMAITRFRAFTKMADELSEAKTRLQSQSIIGKAKQILMDRKGMSENEAHQLIRKIAMSKQTKMSEIASAIILSSEETDH